MSEPIDWTPQAVLAQLTRDVRARGADVQWSDKRVAIVTKEWGLSLACSSDSDADRARALGELAGTWLRCTKRVF